MKVYSSIESSQGDFSNGLETHTEENNCEESSKEHDYSTAMVVYGLPHIVLSN